MGLSRYYRDPRPVILDVITSPQEKERRVCAQRRVDLYEDHYAPTLLDFIGRTFHAPEVRDALAPFVPLACANSLLKRIANEIARPVYATAPVRKVEPLSAQEAYDGLATETQAQQLFARVAPLAVATNDLLVLGRYVDDIGQASADVISPAKFSIVPHPAKPSRALAYVYDKDVYGPSGPTVHHVVWDDEVTFELDSDGGWVTTPRAHNLGRAPIVEVHRRLPVFDWFDRHGGEDLVGASLQVAFLNCLMLKLHYQQGERIIAVVGDMADDQTLDGANPIKIEPSPGASITTLDLVTDPGHYLKTKAEIETTIAANHGISRSRLNQQKDGADGDDAALFERTAELVAVMRGVEQDYFEVLKLVSREHPVYELTSGSTLTVDYGLFAERTDRKAQLDILAQEIALGTGNVIDDDIRRRHPEVRTDDEAWEIYERNLEVRAKALNLMRQYQVPSDPTGIGQGAADNGALGPMVRDGELSKQEAALIAGHG